MKSGTTFSLCIVSFASLLIAQQQVSGQQLYLGKPCKVETLEADCESETSHMTCIRISDGAPYGCTCPKFQVNQTIVAKPYFHNVLNKCVVPKDEYCAYRNIRPKMECEGEYVCNQLEAEDYKDFGICSDKNNGNPANAQLSMLCLLSFAIIAFAMSSFV